MAYLTGETLGAAERASYDALFEKAKACIGGHIAAGTLGANYTGRRESIYTCSTLYV